MAQERHPLSKAFQSEIFLKMQNKSKVGTSLSKLAFKKAVNIFYAFIFLSFQIFNGNIFLFFDS
jgi:hypothetical protein